MEAPGSLSVARADSQLGARGDAIVRGDAPSPPDSSTPAQAVAELRCLMLLAERYARRLVSAGGAPSGALLVVHQGDLDLVALDGEPHTPAVGRLLAQRRASSAVLIVDARGPGSGPAGDALHIIGETADGHRDAWQYRLRGCGRSRRLTRQIGRDVGVARRAPSYPLFARVARGATAAQDRPRGTVA